MICIKHISRSYIDCSFHLAIRGSYDEFELTSTRPNPRRLISFKGDMRVPPFLYIFLRNSSLFLLSKIFVWASSSLSRSSVILQTLWNIQPIFTTKNCLSLWWFRVQLWSSQRIRHMGHTDVKVEYNWHLEDTVEAVNVVKVVKIKCSSTEHKATKITGQTKFIAYHNRVLKIKSIHEVY